MPPVSHPRAAAALAAFTLLWHYAALQAAPAAAAVSCAARPAAQAGVTRLRAALAQGRFITYQPTSLKVVDGRFTDADPASIRADLQMLRTHFDALITYDAVHGAEQIPAIATELHFRALIIGVWDPSSPAQLAAALDAAGRFPRLVVGLSLGNETLFAHRLTPGTLRDLITQARTRAPGVPLSTTEPFHIYDEPSARALLPQLDFTLLNVHPVFQPWFRDAPDRDAAQFVVNVADRLAPLGCGPLLVKETGVPTAPPDHGFSEARQAGFYRELRRLLAPTSTQTFAYFAAFDAPWRAYDATGVPGATGVHAEEAHWGLYDAQRRPKAAARELPALGR